MKKFAIRSVFHLCLGVLIGAFAIQSFAQTTKPSPTPEVNDDDEIVKITTSLVQLDAVVTDTKGDPVTDLDANDFEIYQDGKLQDLTNFSFVDTTIKKKNTTSKIGRKRDKNAVIPPTRSRNNNTGRVITFVVDDGNCAASAVGMSETRRALKKFVIEQMQPNDAVSIYRTMSGRSLLQQYTSDRSQLLKIIKKIRWRPLIGCASSGDFFQTERQWDNILLRNDPKTDGVSNEERDREAKETRRETNRDAQVIGALGVIRYIVRGLERIPGRKLMFLMSDGISIIGSDGLISLPARDQIRYLTDEANRAAVVINTVDVRGVTNPAFISAADDVRPDLDFGSENNRISRVSEGRLDASRSLRSGMELVADETGGNFYHGNNNLSVHLRKALNREKGYYLLGYEPAEETFKGTKYHEIEIKLKRPELRVYSRAGFIGSETRKRKKRKGDSELYEALVAPLPNAGIGMRLTAFFGNTTAEGNFIRSLVHIDGKDIKFIDSKDGLKKAVFDVIAVTLGKKNKVIDEFNRSHTVQIDARAIPMIEENGLVYTTDVGVKKSGVYDFRVAIRDVNSSLIGSARQVVSVPRLKANKIFASGLTISGVDRDGKFSAPSSVSIQRAISLVGSADIPAIRSFTGGKMLGYSYKVYGAKLDKSTKKPKIGQIVTIYKDGDVITNGKAEVVDLPPQEDWSRANVIGYLRLPKNVEPGDYSLQVTVRDLLTNKTDTHWIDFEVVN